MDILIFTVLFIAIPIGFLAALFVDKGAHRFIGGCIAFTIMLIALACLVELSGTIAVLFLLCFFCPPVAFLAAVGTGYIAGSVARIVFRLLGYVFSALSPKNLVDA